MDRFLQKYFAGVRLVKKTGELGRVWKSCYFCFIFPFELAFIMEGVLGTKSVVEVLFALLFLYFLSEQGYFL